MFRPPGQQLRLHKADEGVAVDHVQEGDKFESLAAADVLLQELLVERN